MKVIKVIKRTLSLGEVLDNQRRSKSLAKSANTYTYSVKVSNGHYLIYQAKK